MRPDDLVVFYLRDPARPTEPILQIGTTKTGPGGRFEWSFVYPNDSHWTSITAASVIVQSTATGGYVTVPLRVVPGGTIPTAIVPTRPAADVDARADRSRSHADQSAGDLIPP